MNDQNACAVSQPVLITEPTLLSVALSTTDVLCNGNGNGADTVAIVGGTPAYTFIWSNRANTQNINAVTAGNYSVTVTDANSCSTSQSATINQPTAFTLSVVKTDVACNGGTNGNI